MLRLAICIVVAALVLSSQSPAQDAQPATAGAGALDPAAVKPGVWHKRTPLPGAPRNPRMGYEGAWAYDPFSKAILRWGGHNNGGGGEQNSEMWVYDPAANTFKLMEPNYSPPGACCNREQVFDVANRRYVRFPSFSASHGWQWRREVYQMQSSVWTYDLPGNQWRNMRPWPQANPGPMRGAAYAPDDQITVVCQGEGVRWGAAVYDLYANTWHMMNAKNEPPERNTFGMAYDPASRKFVTFGNQYKGSPKTWIYDLAGNEWKDVQIDPHPPEAANGAVMAYDPFNKVILCVAMTHKDGLDEDKKPAKVPDCLETWAFDPAKLTWTNLNAKVPAPGTSVRGTLLVYVPDLNIFVLENRTGNWKDEKGVAHQQEQQEWIFRYAEAPAIKDPPPAPPTDVKVAATADPAAALSWGASPSANVAAYRVYRGMGEKPWLVNYAKAGEIQMPGGKTTFGDHVTPAAITYYYVTAVDKAGRESTPSLKVRTQPRAIVDVLVNVTGPKKVELAWEKPGDDIAGYNVYRAPLAVSSTDQYGPIRDKQKLANPLPEPTVGTWRIAGEFVKLTDKPVAEPAFTDTAVDLTTPNATTQPFQYSDPKGKPYKFAVFAYRVTAVNKLGVESGPSPYYLTIPGPVCDLKSRERKGETDLRWTASKEKSVVGYRVYRMEGRFDNNGMTLLTPDPIKGTTYTDKIANGPEDDAKRYYVVAVDSLGQEGIVGSPTWGAREYAKYYVGFLEEWHQ